MTQSAAELILLETQIDYSPTFVRTDNRRSTSSITGLGHMQIGKDEQYGNTTGPIFRIEFVDVSSVTATHVKLWGVANSNSDSIIYPLSYITSSRRVIDIIFKKFDFCNSSGVSVPETTYTVVGHKTRS